MDSREITEIQAIGYEWICPCCGFYNHLNDYPEDEAITCEGCEKQFTTDHPTILR